MATPGGLYFDGACSKVRHNATSDWAAAGVPADSAIQDDGTLTRTATPIARIK